ncbi:cytidine deaminase-like protein [Suillus occidentalis]|nr:cytidine deaminase-like protein [Suillus occidentalis]
MEDIRSWTITRSNGEMGRMALALGLGSLFNHSSHPNVSYTIDTAHDCIRYTSTRTINLDEELCIFYGHKLWFDPVGTTANLEPQVCLDQSDQSAFLDILAIDSEMDEAEQWNTKDPNDILEGEALPFIWKKLQIDEEEESMEDIRTMQAWAVDIPGFKIHSDDVKVSRAMLYHISNVSGKKTSISTLLLSVSSSVPVLPANVDIGDPYRIYVPCNPALTQTSLVLKNTLWPTVYAPRRKWEPEKWSIAKVQWARDAISHILRKTARIMSSDELPVVAHVPKPFEDEALLSRSFTSGDTRMSTGHPLRHAAMNIIRDVADWRAKTSPTDLLPYPLKSAISESDDSLGISDTSCNGTNYLLTGLTLFITHEPCIMCSMALLHSRVKEVFYIVPMPQTGGCGGSACLPALKDVNHRYSIAHWRSREGGAALAPLDEQIDA